jgi:hypothetical protein
MHGGTRFDANMALLSEMVDRLGDLANNFVFVGGCATGLLITTARAQIIRGIDPARDGAAVYRDKARSVSRPRQ